MTGTLATLGVGMTPTILTGALAALCAGIVAIRCICIVNNMDHRHAGIRYLHFLGFGLSYALLAAGALYSMFRIWDNHGDAGHWLFLVSSAGLIVFDRRRRRDCFDPNVCRKEV